VVPVLVLNKYLFDHYIQENVEEAFTLNLFIDNLFLGGKKINH